MVAVVHELWLQVQDRNIWFVRNGFFILVKGVNFFPKIHAVLLMNSALHYFRIYICYFYGII